MHSIAEVQMEKLTGLLKGLVFTDVVDILIVSYILYRVINYIRSTRAWQLAKGVLMLIAGYFLTEVFSLYTANWLLRGVLNVGALALVVVFQPELRRALEYLGRGKFTGRGYSVERERVSAIVDILLRSVEYMSSRRIGAIVVMENETALQDVAETGTLLDARLTEPLIENIFFKGSPLHDGATIIREDRVLSAGCVLPLTENPNLSKDLGTRHRAAIGISEVSDALVIVVSEETGIISIAQDGKLSRFLDLKSVEKALLELYLKKYPQNESRVMKMLNSTFRKEDDESELDDK